MITDRPPPSDELPARLVPGSIALFWMGWIALMTARAAVLGFDEPVAMLGRRVLAAQVGAALTWLMWQALRRVRTRRPAVLTLAALAGAMPATAAFACANWWLFYGWPTAATAADVARWGAGRVFRYAVVDTSVSWFFFFAGWALTFQFLAAAHRASGAERQRIEAELRALRYQLDPHFLFNALNTLAELVAAGDAAAADRMILDLSALLRRMLTSAPATSVTLAEELALHRRYLAIEQQRFGDRLHVEVTVEDGLEDMLVPALILQPLVENAVKHGLAATPGPAAVRLVVCRRDGRLTLSVENSGGDRTPRDGFGIGLANVRERLRLIHGRAAALRAGPAGDGWRAEVTLPIGSALG